MYQTQYSNKLYTDTIQPQQAVSDEYDITHVRATMWEEHCLECAAPECFNNCSKYIKRSDGRCARFEDGIHVFDTPKGAQGMAARMTFRPWGNMMTQVYSNFEDVISSKQHSMIDATLNRISKSRLSSRLKWWLIRPLEYIRRRQLNADQSTDASDAFVLHVYSHNKETYSLIMEVFKATEPLQRFAFEVKAGENMFTLSPGDYSDACDRRGNTIKIYPENDFEAVLDIYWCHFIKGQKRVSKKPDTFVKCLVWDLDNTLWDGVLIETDHPDDLKLKNKVLETIKEIDHRGILQSVASKNDFEPAMAHLKSLGIDEYFLYPEIHWNPKSQSIKDIANQLNINIDSFAFIDDSAFERQQVAGEFPQVRVFTEKDLEALLDHEAFNPPQTATSSQRRKMYMSEANRMSMKTQKKLDIKSFIRACEIEITIFAPDGEQEKNRCLELIQRTNQLNISGIKYTEQAFNDLLVQDSIKSIAISCKDKFGEYGIICFAQYELEENHLVFKEFAMSCRVANKYIESALFNQLKKQHEKADYIFPIRVTKKNDLMRRTIDNIGLVKIEETASRVVYSFNHDIDGHDLVDVKLR